MAGLVYLFMVLGIVFPFGLLFIISYLNMPKW